MIKNNTNTLTRYTFIYKFSVVSIHSGGLAQQKVLAWTNTFCFLLQLLLFRFSFFGLYFAAFYFGHPSLRIPLCRNRFAGPSIQAGYCYSVTTPFCSITFAYNAFSPVAMIAYAFAASS